MSAGRPNAGSLLIFPDSDEGFRDKAEETIAAVPRPRVLDAAFGSAVEALLRESYPLANVSRRDSLAAPGLDVFRDGDTLDVQLVLRMKSGDRVAAGRLFDRHAALVYSIAARTTADRDLARTAVVDTFRASKTGPIDPESVRVSLARTARAMSVGLARPPSETAAGLGVLAVELATTHELTAAQIASILRLDRADVGRLVNRTLLARRRR